MVKGKLDHGQSKVELGYHIAGGHLGQFGKEMCQLHNTIDVEGMARSRVDDKLRVTLSMR